MKNYILILLVALILGACSPQKRLHRLLALHPYLVQNDTIHIIDTTIIPEVRIDTLVHIDQLRDTIIITKENIRVKIHQVKDTVYIEAQREADTVVVTKEIAVERVVYQKPIEEEVKWDAIVFSFFILFMLIYFIKKVTSE